MLLCEKYGYLQTTTPIKYVDGSAIYAEFAEEFRVHKQGFFIMAPSGSGKSYFVNHQREKHWMDGDLLWYKTGALPNTQWWLKSNEILNEMDQRCDIITAQAKKLGFWIIGTSNYWLKPDAIVIPHWSTHKKYIRAREQKNYDGGATLDRLNQVLGHRKWIMQWAKKGVPKFNSIEAATSFLSHSYQKSLGV